MIKVAIAILIFFLGIQNSFATSLLPCKAPDQNNVQSFTQQYGFIAYIKIVKHVSRIFPFRGTKLNDNHDNIPMLASSTISEYEFKTIKLYHIRDNISKTTNKILLIGVSGAKPYRSGARFIVFSNPSSEALSNFKFSNFVVRGFLNNGSLFADICGLIDYNSTSNALFQKTETP